MDVFVTGASGFIGSATVAELVAAGHRVTGLARSDAAADKVAKMGAQVRRGDLDDLDGLRAAAAAAEGVIHLGFIHDFANFAHSIEVDRRAVEVMAGAVRPGGSLVNTIGTAVLAGPNVATEDAVPDPGPVPLVDRLPSERAGLAAADRGVRGSVVRLPPSVCGVGDHHGFIPMLVAIARKAGVSGYIGTGENRWPSVNVLDAAHLYRLAVEAAPARSALHGVGDAGTPMRQIAEAIGAGLNVPARSIPVDGAESHFGWLGRFLMLDNPTSNAITRQLLGWEPTHKALMAELRDGTYTG